MHGNIDMGVGSRTLYGGGGSMVGYVYQGLKIFPSILLSAATLYINSSYT